MIATELVTAQPRAMTEKLESIVPPDLAAQMRPERVGYRLKLLREASNLKPSEMADKLGIERTYWSRFEGGKRQLSDSVAALLVSRFDVTLDFLILGRWEKLPFDMAEKLRAAEAKNS